jgi:uncharacterized protein YneF (UPF0154 family)
MENQQEKPPILGTWNNVYFMVIAVLAALITGFYFFTKYFQ